MGSVEANWVPLPALTALWLPGLCNLGALPAEQSELGAAQITTASACPLSSLASGQRQDAVGAGMAALSGCALSLLQCAV